MFGQMSGEGIMTYPRGHSKQKYIGYFVEDEFNGKGSLVWANGFT